MLYYIWVNAGMRDRTDSLIRLLVWVLNEGHKSSPSMNPLVGDILVLDLDNTFKPGSKLYIYIYLKVFIELSKMCLNYFKTFWSTQTKIEI